MKAMRRLIRQSGSVRVPLHRLRVRPRHLLHRLREILHRRGSRLRGAMTRHEQIQVVEQLRKGRLLPTKDGEGRLHR